MKYIIVYTTVYPSASLAGGDDIDENIDKIESIDKLHEKILELKKRNIDFEVYQYIHYECLVDRAILIKSLA